MNYVQIDENQRILDFDVWETITKTICLYRFPSPLPWDGGDPLCFTVLFVEGRMFVPLQTLTKEDMIFLQKYNFCII